jgi:tetratricopeptide (TPR) repeat protein
MRPFPGFISLLLIFFMVSITILGVPRALFGQETPRVEKASGKKAGEDLKPVPYPPLDHLEKAVSDQLREGRRMVDAVSGDSSASRQKRAEAYGELGQLYHAYELNEAAEACYRNALVLDPSHLEWTYSLGYLLQFTGRFPEALQFYQRMKMKIDPQNPQLAYLLHIRMGECYRNLNQTDRAKSAFEAAYRLDPGEPAVLARLGEIALDEKHFDSAIKYFTSALEKQPDANRLHYSLAMAYRGKGDMEKARFHLGKRGMVGVQPPDPLKTRLEKLVAGYRLHVLAGKLAFSAGRYNEAIESFQKAIAADPKETGARVNLAAALGQLKKYNEAIAQLEDVIKLEPDNVTAHFNLGTLYGHLNNIKKSIAHLQVVVKMSPKDARAHLALAGALRRDGQVDKALEHYTAALRYDPALTWAWVDMSSLLSQTGKHGEALKVLEDGHSRIPHDGPIAHALARLLASSPILEKRQGKRALELALKVYRAMENFEHARTAAMAYAELNQCDKAVEWMEIAIKLAENSGQPDSVLEMLKRNLAYFKTNRPCRVPAKQ